MARGPAVNKQIHLGIRPPDISPLLVCIEIASIFTMFCNLKKRVNSKSILLSTNAACVCNTFLVHAQI